MCSHLVTLGLAYSTTTLVLIWKVHPISHHAIVNIRELHLIIVENSPEHSTFLNVCNLETANPIQKTRFLNPSSTSMSPSSGSANLVGYAFLSSAFAI